MLTDEYLVANADRINSITEYADRVGAGAASLGTIALLVLDDADYALLKAGDPAANDILDEVEKRFRAAGVRVD